MKIYTEWLTNGFSLTSAKIVGSLLLNSVCLGLPKVALENDGIRCVGDAPTAILP